MTWCFWCGDEFPPVEYRPPSVDGSEPDFCSDDCESAHGDQVECEFAYDEARYSGAPAI